MEEILVGPVEGWRDDELASGIVERGDAERGEKDGRGGLLFDGPKRLGSKPGAE
jgi:hypothetical protein